MTRFHIQLKKDLSEDSIEYLEVENAYEICRWKLYGYTSLFLSI